MHADAVARLKPEPYQRIADTARGESDARLPGLDSEYKAYGQPENNESTSLVLIMGQEGFAAGGVAYYILQYVHIGRGEFGFLDDGQCFSFVWSDLEPKLVKVRGRNLLRIADYIGQRRVPWLRVCDRDFRVKAGPESKEPVITGIEVADWKPKKSDEALMHLLATLLPGQASEKAE
jgi:hypothetical protein